MLSLSTLSKHFHGISEPPQTDFRQWRKKVIRRGKHLLAPLAAAVNVQLLLKYIKSRDDPLKSDKNYFENLRKKIKKRC